MNRPTSIRVASVLLMIVSAGWSRAAGAGDAALYLVQDGKAKAVIVAEESQEKSSAEARAAANELRAYVKKITGADMPVVAEDKAVAGPAIHVGRTAFVKSLNLPLDKLDREGVVLKRVGERIVLAGGGNLGTRHAVRIFLEDIGGVRWFMSGDLWKIVPQSKDLAVGDLDRTENPSYLSRSLSGVLDERWMEWNRANWPTRFWIGHNVGKVIKPALFAEHPEYFPLIGGKRAKPPIEMADWQPCLSNPDVRKLCVEAARKHFDENPENEIFSLAQNDNYGWCECENCVKLNGGMKYDDSGRACYSDLYFKFVNAVCEDLEKTHPGRKVGVMAYQLGTYSPPSVKAHPNVVIQIVNDHSRFHFDPTFRKAEQEYLSSWAQVGKAFSFHNWHYGTRYLVPRLEIKSTREFLQYGHKLGAVGYHGEEYPNWGLEGPKTYITSRLLWNVNADVDALLQDFYARCFEDAAEPMRKYFETLEDAWNSQPILNIHVNSLYLWREDRRQFNIVTPAVVAKCYQHLDEAQRLAKSDLVRKRIAHLRKTFRITDYYVRREAVYKALKAEEHLKPATFAELTANLNEMCFATTALLQHTNANIKGDLTTFHNAQPGYVKMDVYYCELGSRLAEALARGVVKDLGKPTPEAFGPALAARFDELSKTVAEAPPVQQGPAWEEFSNRVRNYLGATAFVPRLKAAPAIDGKADAAEWEGAPSLSRFFVFKSGRVMKDPPKRATTVRVGFDDQALYVAYTCQDDPATLVATHDKRDSGVWQDDAADFVLLPAGCEKDQFLHFIANSKGVVYDAKGEGPRSGDWNGNIKVAAGRDDAAGTWTVEAAIPWADFGKKPASGEVWRAQFARIDREGTQQDLSSWAPTTKGFNNADDLGVLLFE